MINLFENVTLKNFNTFGIEARARYFSGFSGLDELIGLVDFNRPAGVAAGSLLVLGGGSNILFTRDFDGLVLRNEIKGIELVHEDAEYVYVRAGAGENWHGFVQYCLGRDWAGVENLSLIPGSVGAAPMQNIGAYGVEIKEVFYELSAFHLEEKKVYTFGLNDCAFGYRESVFKRRYKGQFVILDVTFRLRKRPRFHTEYGAIREELEKMGVRELSIQAISNAVIHIRQSKLPDPAVIGNAGSFFKNPTVTEQKFAELNAQYPNIIGYPVSGAGAASGSVAHTETSSGAATGAFSGSSPSGVKLAAGWLIEQCGWKGYRRGDAGCHARQALVLVNYGDARGQEIYDLSEEILRSVRTKFGVELEREVNIIP
jgi:UDP-N-acetylmuramate dehydrogenase